MHMRFLAPAVAVFVLAIAGCGGLGAQASPGQDATVADAEIDDGAQIDFDTVRAPDPCTLRISCPTAVPEVGAPCAGSGVCEYDRDAGCPRRLECVADDWRDYSWSYCPAFRRCANNEPCTIPSKGARCVGDAGECVCEKGQWRCGDSGPPRCPSARPLSGHEACDASIDCLYSDDCRFQRCECGKWWQERFPYPCD